MPKPRKKKAGKKKAKKAVKKKAARKPLKKGRQKGLKLVRGYKPKLKAIHKQTHPPKYPPGMPTTRIVLGKTEVVIPYIWRMKKLRPMHSKERILKSMDRLRQRQKYNKRRSAELARLQHLGWMKVEQTLERFLTLRNSLRSKRLTDEELEYIKKESEGFVHSEELTDLLLLLKDRVYNLRGQAFLQSTQEYFDAVMNHSRVLIDTGRFLGSDPEWQWTRTEPERIKEIIGHKLVVETQLDRLKEEDKTIRSEILSLKDFLIDSRDEWL